MGDICLVVASRFRCDADVSFAQVSPSSRSEEHCWQGALDSLVR